MISSQSATIRVPTLADILTGRSCIRRRAWALRCFRARPARPVCALRRRTTACARSGEDTDKPKHSFNDDRIGYGMQRAGTPGPASRARGR